MIKKMMALLTAISCAIGAWADVSGHLSGTDFSGLSAGPFVTGLDDSGQSSGTTKWFVGDTADFAGTIVTNLLEKKFLDFESNITNPLYRTINGCYGATSPSGFTPQAIGTGLFIDTTVQFTPYLVNENHPAPAAVTAQDKLIVWVRETEVENDANITNLIVTAGYYDAFDSVSASNYVVNLTSAQVSEICSHTNRLTIKSYSCLTDTAGGPAGFVVYLNEQALEYEGDAFAAGCTYLADLAATPASYYESGHHKLFPSLMGDLEDYNKLSGVGYAGMGKISDVFFDDYSTDYPLFAADPINFRVVPGDGVASYVYDNVRYTSEQSFSVAPSVASVTISNVVYSSGWQHKTGTWYNGTTIVNNAEGVGGDYGTFVFTDGTTLNLAGFQANYTVGGTPYQTLFGGTVTEPTGAFAAAKNGGTIVLNSDITIAEGTQKQIVVGENDELTIDLNGHTIQGTADDATIVNEGGILSIIDSSVGQTGKVLGSLVANPDYDPDDPDSEPLVNNYQAVLITELATATRLNAGTYELIAKDEGNNTLVISNGSYLCYSESGSQPAEFYLQGSVAPGATVAWSQDPDTGFWYATVSGSVVVPCDVTFSTNNVVVAEWSQVVNSGDALTAAKIPDVSGLTGSWDAPAPTAESVITSNTNFNFTVAAPVVTWDITFSTNKVIVTEWNLTVDDGDPIGNAIPNFTGGSWDDPAPTAETVVNSNTNFNYTIPYTLTYVTAHGVTPDGATYTNGAPNFALAAAPTADGWTFGGWLIGSDVFEAGDTYVVADHLANTTATAIWTPTAYTLTYVTEKGTAPDAVSYTVESNNFALAAAPTAEGWTFAGWVIGSVTNEAGATFVVADHLENTTATAAWVAVVPPAYFPQTDIDPSSPYAGRDGTTAKPFVIRNLADLEAFKTYVEDGTFASSSFEVVSNITATGWVGVGTSSSAAFAGTFNGGGNTITLSLASEEYNALFRFVNNATISNLTVNITGIDATASSFGGAAFVGKAYGSCTFETLKATGTLGTAGTPTTHNTAGICVRIYGDDGVMNFNSCTNAMDIYANYTKVGGMVAVRSDNYNTQINFNNCVNIADISNANSVVAECSGTGGFMGWTGYSNPSHIAINGCASIGSVTAANGTAGSWVGYVSATPAMSGVNTALASISPSGTPTSTGVIGGCDWATVDGDIATFVTPVATVDSVVAYKVMQANSSPNFTLAAAAASLTIDSSLAAYSGTVSVDESLAEDYNLRQTAIATGVIYSLESKTPADPWAPTEETDVAASNKVVEIFGADSKVASKVTTLAQYEALVTYIKSVTSASEVPGDLTAGQKTYMWESFILGADPLFEEEPAVEITDVTANTVAGKWDFTVKVTEGESTDAYDVAEDKVAALVKIRTSLSTGTWVAPTAGNIEAVKLLGGNLIKVTVNYGDGTSGFMKVSE